jgi:fatty acid-binding protein DegV
MLIKATPIIAIEEFDKLLTHLQNIRPNNKAIADLYNTLEILKKRGLPRPGTYSFNNIHATDTEDLQLKMGLIVAMFFKYAKSGNTTKNDITNAQLQIDKLMDAITNEILGSNASFPISITID